MADINLNTDMLSSLCRPHTLAWAASAVGGRLCGPKAAAGEFDSVTTDSRLAGPGTLFVAIKGERLDGHAFVGRAFEKNAAAALCSEKTDAEADGAVIYVGDTVAALGRLAAAYRQELAPLTVAVTGSVGKTTTKEYIYSVLSQKFEVHKTDGNYNNLIGLPMVLLKLSDAQKAIVLEMGMSARGEIERLSLIARPDIAVITNIGTSHIGLLGSREAIRDAKLEIRRGMEPGGILILNGDEPLLAGIEGAVYISAENPASDYRISGVVQRSEGLTSFDLAAPDGKISGIEIPTIGLHTVFDAAYAFAVGLKAGLDEAQIRRGLMNYRPTGLRQRIYEVRGITVIADCYNASPESMKAALTVERSVADKRGGRSIAVLGDMLELGDSSPQYHIQVGRMAAQRGITRLYAFGAQAANYARGALDGGMPAEHIACFDETAVNELAEELDDALIAGDTVMFKASRAMRLERVIDALGFTVKL